jgi:16S rRNA processing protein RimM
MVVEPLTSDPSRFSSLKEVFVGKAEANAGRRSVGQVQMGGKGVRLRLDGVETRTEAEALVGSFLFVPAEARIPLAQGSYFVEQVVGLKVLSENGAEIGRVKEVMKLPAQDVYVVEKNGSQILIPAVREFVLRIDLREGIMVVKLIEGLIAE